MRNFGLFTILCLQAVAPACTAQSSDTAVVAVLNQMEQAIQRGDFPAYTSLFDAETRAKASSGPEKIPARPTVRFQATKTLVRGDSAAVIAAMTDSAKPAMNNHVTFRLVRENGAWKIADQLWSDPAPDPVSIYAIVPPESGAFLRAGSPWQGVAPAVPNTKYFRPEQIRWKLQATFDESFLYLRIDAGNELPAVNSEVPGEFPNLKSPVQRGWPAMTIKVVTAQKSWDYMFTAEDQVGDQATFDEHGKANSHHHYVAYSLRLWKGNATVFSAAAGARDQLVSVQGRCLDLRIPLKTLNLDGARGIKLFIGDANSASQIEPYAVAGYGL
ncbi:MAG TPA: nuclear transport factor 2 family protein [Bryobacteraceae bacterium]|nr:nuclear transport factor 2 family protein [Bryobacteraceae bacterium]